MKELPHVSFFRRIELQSFYKLRKHTLAQTTFTVRNKFQVVVRLQSRSTTERPKRKRRIVLFIDRIEVAKKLSIIEIVKDIGLQDLHGSQNLSLNSRNSQYHF